MLAPNLELEFGERLSLITGDNGLGKSFLLEFAWWAATGTWAHRPALPNLTDRGGAPRVEYSLRGNSGRLTKGAFSFDFQRNIWSLNSSSPNVEALSIFARADSSFAVYDPVRSQLQGPSDDQIGLLTSDDVWNGKGLLIEGLIRDWVRWQKAENKLSFDRFCSVLRRLSPEDLGELTPGATIRIPGDSRDIPTIKHKYGTVPIIHASSGVQRVLLLAYLIIWAWQEHELAATQLSREPLRRLVVFIDEPEAHLHPKWQRIVLPALMSIGDLLSGELTIQTIAATHSPMILASMEPSFDPEQDTLHHLFADLGAVKLENIPFVKYGDASGWLMSPLFGLQHARSREAERTIERAKAVQLEEQPSAARVQELTDELRRLLSNDDKFWPRWLYFAEKHGVEL
ncbi:MAG: ATP-binding protein [Rhodospirillaceae bacterium]|nr:ATP-binding protein [Rhodospirillaceae bacterium]